MTESPFGQTGLPIIRNDSGWVTMVGPYEEEMDAGNLSTRFRERWVDWKRSGSSECMQTFEITTHYKEKSKTFVAE